MKEKRKINVWALIFIILLDILFIAYFLWSEYKLNIFHVWHAVVLPAILVLLILNYLTSWLKFVSKFITKYIGIEKESKSIDSLREYYLENMPIIFFVSAYTMQSGFKDDNVNIILIIGSVVMLLISLYFAFAGVFGRVIKESVLKWTYRHTEWLGVLAMAAFIFELISVTKDLPTFWSMSFLIIGILYLIFIGLHYILNINKYYS